MHPSVGWQRFRGLVGTAAVMSASIGLAVGFTLAAVHLDAISGAEASSTGTELPSSIQLAQAFTAALNAHDVDAVVELFTEEDAGPTVTADRYAWEKFEIRLWAQQQAQGGFRADAYDYRVTDHGATWGADVYRDDWRALGVTAVRVLNTIWVHNGYVADFTSELGEPSDQLRLGRLWQPGTIPERPTVTWRPNATSGQLSERIRST
jgi:hypothetical protein